MLAEIRPPTRFLILSLATGFGSGYCPKIPGTAGTVAGLILYIAMAGFSWPIYLLLLIILSLAGIWICEQGSRMMGNTDPAAVVWDEIVGVLIALAAIPYEWGWILAGFVLFRILDISKPGPIGWVERRFHGGLGIMLDDILAGLFTLIILQVAQWSGLFTELSL